MQEVGRVCVGRIRRGEATDDLVADSDGRRGRGDRAGGVGDRAAVGEKAQPDSGGVETRTLQLAAIGHREIGAGGGDVERESSRGLGIAGGGLPEAGLTAVGRAQNIGGEPDVAIVAKHRPLQIELELIEDDARLRVGAEAVAGARPGSRDVEDDDSDEAGDGQGDAGGDEQLDDGETAARAARELRVES